jgi:Tol biopolymer transport system component
VASTRCLPSADRWLGRPLPHDRWPQPSSILVARRQAHSLHSRFDPEHEAAYRETEETLSHHPIELSIMNADGRNRRVLRVIEPVIYSLAWSPDGTTLAISAATSAKPGEPVQAGVFLLPANEKGELRLFRANAWTPSWSPDGSRLAFTVEHPRGRWRIHTAKVDGSEEIAIGDAAVDNGSPSWSPDGRQIAFDQFTGVTGRQQVFVMKPDGSDVRQVTAD